ncbi:MAG: hypothetical protein AAF581_12865 [Planctomycetota bacterium]
MADQPRAPRRRPAGDGDGSEGRRRRPAPKRKAPSAGPGKGGAGAGEGAPRRRPRRPQPAGDADARPQQRRRRPAPAADGGATPAKKKRPRRAAPAAEGGERGQRPAGRAQQPKQAAAGGRPRNGGEQAAKPRRRPPAEGAAKPQARGQAAAGKAAAGKPAARRPRPEGGARPRRTTERAAAAGKPQRSAPPARRRREQPPAGGDDNPDQEDEGFHLQERSKTPFYIGIGAVIVIGLGLGIAVLMTDEREVPQGPPVAQEPELSPEEIGRKRAKKSWDRLKKYLADNPGDLDDHKMRLSVFVQGNSKYASDLTDKAQAQLDDIEAEQKRQVNDWFDGLQADVRRYVEAGDFDTAESLFDELPDVFDKHRTNAQTEVYVSLRNQARVDKTAGSSLEDLAAKANRYLKDDRPKIAIAIIDQFNTKYEDDAPDVWTHFQKKRKSIQNGVLVATQGRETRNEKERIAWLAEERRKEKAARLRKWTELKASIKPANQLGKYNLYNWILSTDMAWPVVSGQVEAVWRLLVQNNEAVLSIDNTTGGSRYTGFFTNHWKDYVVEFEMRLTKGTLQLSPRTKSSGGRGGAQSIEPSEWIDLESNEYGADWVKITLEVFQEEVTLTRGDTKEKKTFKGGDGFRLRETGGIVFQAPNDSAWDIRRVKTRLVTHSREKLY